MDRLGILAAQPRSVQRYQDYLRRATQVPVRVSCLPRGLFPFRSRDPTLNRKGYTVGAWDTQTRGIAPNLDMTVQRLILTMPEAFCVYSDGGLTFREWQVLR